MNDIQLWERQDGETAGAFGKFKIYRDMGPNRSIVKAAKVAKISKQYLEVLSIKNNWQERVLAYDRYLDKLGIEAMEKVVKDMYKRHAKHAMSLEGAMMSFVNDYIKRYNAGEIKFDGVSDIQRLYAIGMVADKFSKIVDVERKSRGEPTDIVKNDVEITAGIPISKEAKLKAKELFDAISKQFSQGDSGASGSEGE